MFGCHQVSKLMTHSSHIKIKTINESNVNKIGKEKNTSRCSENINHRGILCKQPFKYYVTLIYIIIEKRVLIRKFVKKTTSMKRQITSLRATCK